MRAYCCAAKRARRIFCLIAVFFVWVVCPNPAMSFSVKPTAKASATLDICSVLVEDLSDPVNVYRISAGSTSPKTLSQESARLPQ